MTVPRLLDPAISGGSLSDGISRRYYAIAGLTIEVRADLPITDETYAAKFALFEVDGPSDDTIYIHHHFGIPDVSNVDLGREVYRRPPWSICRSEGHWVYRGIGSGDSDRLERLAIFTSDHTRGAIYNSAVAEKMFPDGRLASLTLFPTDQILLARVLAERGASYIHSSGVILDGSGLLFVGRSEAGKSTTIELLQGEGEPLCDDRNVVRVWPDGVRVHGTWSHGEVPLVSAADAPLRAILFLHQRPHNRLVPLETKATVVERLLPSVVRPLLTSDWWHRTLDVLEHVAATVPCYDMEFDKSGAIVPLLHALARGEPMPTTGRG